MLKKLHAAVAKSTFAVKMLKKLTVSESTVCGSGCRINCTAAMAKYTF